MDRLDNFSSTYPNYQDESEIDALNEMARWKRLEAEGLQADASRLRKQEEDFGDQAKICSEKHDVHRGWITSIERDIKLTESEITEKETEVREEEEYVEIHRQAAKRFRDQEKEKREEARNKMREAELLCSQADAQCVRGLPERAMGNFAVARPILERARDLQLEGQQAERDAEELLKTADEAERKFDLILGRAICIAQGRHHLVEQLEELKEKLGWQQLALEREQGKAEEMKNECLILREEVGAIGKKASEFENQVQLLRQQASEAENKAAQMLQQFE